MVKKINLFNQIREFNSKFWFVNLLQMFERISYAAVVLQMAVYISQKDLVGGLQWEHTTKGTIFFFWAIVQNLTPVFLGGFADRFGRKKMILFASFFVLIGYYLLGSQREYFPFLLGTIFLGFGLGIYKPAIQGWIAKSMVNAKESVGWGINMMLINFAVFFSPSLASYLQSISWSFLFWGSGIIFSINTIAVLFIKDEINQTLNNENMFDFTKNIFSNLIKPKLLFIVLIMSGFTMIYMQFYETLPNFIIDWVDTSKLISYLNLPEFMTAKTDYGIMIDFKYLYAINSGVIVLFVVLVSHFMSGIKPLKGLIFGIIIASVGLWLAGLTSNGGILVFAMVLYTFGELITNPRFNEYMSGLGKNLYKSMYLGFMNISFAIGLAGGSLLGGWLYKNFGEKSGLAIQYMSENYGIDEQINHSNAISTLMEKANLNYYEVTQLLWNTYNPYLIWYVFLGIGILSVILLIIYERKVSHTVE